MSAHHLIRRDAAAVAALGIGIAWIAGADAAPRGRQPDAAHGSVIAAQGTAAGAPACALCHGFDGSSDGSGAFPRIAGQAAEYLASQMRDYASSVRANAVMTPVSKALSPEDVADVAAFYAGVNGAFLPLPNPDPTLIKRGEQLATLGDDAKNIPACNNCHGPGGAGEPPLIPYLGGQYAHYTAFQLQMWQRGFRKNSAALMGDVAGLLDDRDIAATAAYFQQIRSSAGSLAQQKD